MLRALSQATTSFYLILALTERYWFANNSFFQEKLDKNEMSQRITNLFKKFSIEEFMAIDNKDLKDRVDGILVINAMAGMLTDLTSEEIEIFDAAVEGR